MLKYIEYVPSPRDLMSEKHLLDQLLAADIFHLLFNMPYIVWSVAFPSAALPSLRGSRLTLQRSRDYSLPSPLTRPSQPSIGSYIHATSVATATQTRPVPLSWSLSLSSEYNYPDLPRRENGKTKILAPELSHLKNLTA